MSDLIYKTNGEMLHSYNHVNLTPAVSAGSGDGAAKRLINALPKAITLALNFPQNAKLSSKIVISLKNPRVSYAGGEQIEQKFLDEGIAQSTSLTVKLEDGIADIKAEPHPTNIYLAVPWSARYLPESTLSVEIISVRFQDGSSASFQDLYPVSRDGELQPTITIQLKPQESKRALRRITNVELTSLASHHHLASGTQQHCGTSDEASVRKGLQQTLVNAPGWGYGTTKSLGLLDITVPINYLQYALRFLGRQDGRLIQECVNRLLYRKIISEPGGAVSSLTCTALSWSEWKGLFHKTVGTERLSPKELEKAGFCYDEHNLAIVWKRSRYGRDASHLEAPVSVNDPANVDTPKKEPAGASQEAGASSHTSSEKIHASGSYFVARSQPKAQKSNKECLKRVADRCRERSLERRAQIFEPEVRPVLPVAGYVNVETFKDKDLWPIPVNKESTENWWVEATCQDPIPLRPYIQVGHFGIKTNPGRNSEIAFKEEYKGKEVVAPFHFEEESVLQLTRDGTGWEFLLSINEDKHYKILVKKEHLQKASELLPHMKYVLIENRLDLKNSDFDSKGNDKRFAYLKSCDNRIER